VLSMQNNYKGPPEAFALVIPVPTVLQEADVKTLPKEVFDARRSDGRAAAGRVLGRRPLLRAGAGERTTGAERGDGGAAAERRRRPRTWA
jgi:hypothetical protein